MRTTIFLVHGAFAESSSWDRVAATLSREGHRVIGYANPMRGVAHDAAGLTDHVRTTDGPVLLVGHSYGGAVITNVAADAGDIRGLVYVSAFALEAGESSGDASNSVPGSSLGDALVTVPLTGGGSDQYIAVEKYHRQFCADLPSDQAAAMAISQRPVAAAALAEPSGPTPLWKSVTSWFIFGDQDLNIPVAAHRAMARRANAVRTEEIAGASHVVGLSHPEETAALILDAAARRD